MLFTLVALFILAQMTAQWRIANRRQISDKAKIWSLIAALIFGPIAFLIPLVWTRFSRYPAGPVRDLMKLEWKKTQLENKMAKVEARLHKANFPPRRERLEKKLAGIKSDIDQLVIKKAQIYNPIISHEGRKFIKLTPEEQKERIEQSRIINDYHTSHLNSNDMTPEEKKRHVENIRSEYARLNEKGKIKEHISKLKF